jgi:hypothetical protein
MQYAGAAAACGELGGEVLPELAGDTPLAALGDVWV